MDHAPLNQAGQPFAGYIHDITAALVNQVHFFSNRVNPDHFEAGLGKHHRQGQSHVSQTQDAHNRTFILELVNQILFNRHDFILKLIDPLIFKMGSLAFSMAKSCSNEISYHGASQ